MSSTADSKVLGVVLLIRHGDREGFYQDPATYTATGTTITALGNQQEIQLGAQLRALYLNASSPSYIQGISTGLFNSAQVQVRADAGDEGGVIYDSAVSLTQGMWPPTTSFNTTLANGSTIVGPFGGYQYVPIASVDPNLDVSLEGFTSCNTFNNATAAFYNSNLFKQKQNETSAFISQLPQYLDGRPATLQNMWNIFDFMNVQSIHNATFFRDLPPTFLAQVRDLANWHEYNVFSSPQPNGIGNIAGQTVLPSILKGFASISNASDPRKLVYQAISYKPFLSLFNMTSAAQANPQLASIVNYAAAVAFEVRQPASGGEPVIRFNFKNGTDDAEFKTYNFLNGSGDAPVSTFVNTFSPYAINTTSSWCTACSNTKDRGCAALTANTHASSSKHQKISPVGAGFLGAGLTLVVVAAMLGVLLLLGILTIGGKKKKRGMMRGSDTDSETKA